MITWGISAGGHDAAIAVIRDGRIVQAPAAAEMQVCTFTGGSSVVVSVTMPAAQLPS